MTWKWREANPCWPSRRQPGPERPGAVSDYCHSPTLDKPEVGAGNRDFLTYPSTVLDLDVHRQHAASRVKRRRESDGALVEGHRRVLLEANGLCRGIKFRIERGRNQGRDCTRIFYDQVATHD